MAEESLVAELAHTFGELDALQAQDHAAETAAAAEKRLAYYQAQVATFQRELHTLCLLAQLLKRAFGEVVGAQVWAATREELRAQEPITFRAPGRAILAGDLDLLHLVQYTSAATAVARERRMHLAACLSQLLELRTVGQPATSISTLSCGEAEQLTVELVALGVEIDRPALLMTLGCPPLAP
jgi:hypothetical protein